jgi:hypothetical protein
MENFIFSYLTENFYIDKSSVGNYGIYLGPRMSDNTPFRAHKLIAEISTNFGVCDKNAKKYIIKWAGVDLDFYWKVGFEFPTIRTIASTTIGVDLVQVVPMSAPLGTLMYIDYTYTSSTK